MFIKLDVGWFQTILIPGLALDRVLTTAYLMNQISTTSGGSAGIRPDCARPNGNLAWILASVSATSRVRKGRRTARHQPGRIPVWTSPQIPQHDPGDDATVPAGVSVERTDHVRDNGLNVDIEHIKDVRNLIRIGKQKQVRRQTGGWLTEPTASKSVSPRVERVSL